MLVLIIIFYVSANLICSGEAVSANVSIFRTRKLTFETSTSLSCRGFSCRTDLEAMVQCHMEAGCMATWFHLDGNNNTLCGTCVCKNNGTFGYDMAGASLHMREFGEEFIPGKRSHPYGIEDAGRDIIPTNDGKVY